LDNLPVLYITDADTEFCDRSSAVLSESFSVRCFSDAMSCVSFLSEKPPSILILGPDIDDSGQNAAIDFCRDIKTENQIHDTHFILILAEGANAAEVEAAHAAGCDEVMVQPVDLAALHRQLRTTYRLASERSSFKQQASYAQQVAMTAMTSMGELGVVLQFLSKCFSCNSPEAIAQEVLSSLVQYGLSGAVQLRGSGESFVESTPGGNTASDTAVLEKLHGVGRIFEFRTRMVINYEYASILMNDVPDDNDQRGRIRDNVAMLAEGAHARVASLMIEQDNRRKQGGIRFALKEILEMTTELRDQQSLRQEEGQRAVNRVIHEFESAFVRFGLTPTQESALINLLVELRQEVSSIGIGAAEVDTKLQRVVRSLQSIAEETF
jgi:CheY-like chemotaxis protein